MLENCLPETPDGTELQGNFAEFDGFSLHCCENGGQVGEVTRSIKPATERILHEHDVFVLMQIVLERPSVYLHELQRALAQTTGMFVSEATICRTLKRFGFSWKKMKYTALQRSDLIRAEYQAEIAIYDPSI